MVSRQNRILLSFGLVAALSLTIPLLSGLASARPNDSTPSGPLSPPPPSPGPDQHQLPPASAAEMASLVSSLVLVFYHRLRLWLLSQTATPPRMLRAAAVVFAALNIKNFPFVWHARIFGTMFYHMYGPAQVAPRKALFAPIITTTRSPLTEIDWNGHKSNSTYYSDLDVSRTAIVTALLRRGMTRSSRYEKHRRARNAELRAQGLPPVPEHTLPVRTRRPPTYHELAAALMQESQAAAAGCPVASKVAETTLNLRDADMTFVMREVPGKHAFALGGSATFFHNEILPYSKVEMWSRVVSWDRKWLYIVTHMVKAGEWSHDLGKKGKWIIQPWRNSSSPATFVDAESEMESQGPEGSSKAGSSAATADSPGSHAELARAFGQASISSKMQKSIYSTSVSRYVLKKGRVTVPPELALRRSDMMPDKPEWAPPSTEIAGVDEIRAVVSSYLKPAQPQRCPRNDADTADNSNEDEPAAAERSVSTKQFNPPVLVRIMDSSVSARTASSVSGPSSSHGSSTPPPPVCPFSALAELPAGTTADSVDPFLAADVYVAHTRRAFADLSAAARAAEIERRAEIEPGRAEDDAAYVPPAAPEAGAPGWAEVERRRAAGLLSVGGHFGKLDAGLTAAFVPRTGTSDGGAVDRDGALGMFFDL